MQPAGGTHSRACFLTRNCSAPPTSSSLGLTHRITQDGGEAKRPPGRMMKGPGTACSPSYREVASALKMNDKRLRMAATKPGWDAALLEATSRSLPSLQAAWLGGWDSIPEGLSSCRAQSPKENTPNPRRTVPNRAEGNGKCHNSEGYGVVE